MARAPVSKTGGWGLKSLHSCQAHLSLLCFQLLSVDFGNSSLRVATV